MFSDVRVLFGMFYFTLTNWKCLVSSSLLYLFISTPRRSRVHVCCGTICLSSRFQPALFCKWTRSHSAEKDFFSCCVGLLICGLWFNRVHYARLNTTMRRVNMADSTELKLDFTLKQLSLSAQSEQEDVPGSSSTVELRTSRLVCVEYPAVVNNVDKMLETLGGEQTVSKVSKS